MFPKCEKCELTCSNRSKSTRCCSLSSNPEESVPCLYRIQGGSEGLVEALNKKKMRHYNTLTWLLSEALNSNMFRRMMPPNPRRGERLGQFVSRNPRTLTSFIRPSVSWFVLFSCPMSRLSSHLLQKNGVTFVTHTPRDAVSWQGKDRSSLGGARSTKDASTLAAVVLWIKKKTILHTVCTSYATCLSGIRRNTPRATCILSIYTRAVRRMCIPGPSCSKVD